jgi:hypothetical protein
MNPVRYPPTNTITRPQPWVLPQPDVETLAAGFAPISLEQMDSIALLNRVDTKFVMTSAQLLTALARVRADYHMLTVENNRLNHYRTLYFDTPEFALYHDHVNGRPERYKVRSREYLDSHLSFMEVKHKTRKERTIKDRVPTAGQVMTITSAVDDWLHHVCPLDGAALEPKLWNTFTRLTLVSNLLNERVTLDIDLTFYTPERAVCLNGLAIAEVKMDAAHGDSPFLRQMRQQRIRAYGFSKYAFGVAMLSDQVKKNALKPRILWVDKLLKGTLHNEHFC